MLAKKPTGQVETQLLLCKNMAATHEVQLLAELLQVAQLALHFLH